MNVHINTRISEKLLAAEELDLEPIAFKLEKEHGWPLDHINHAIEQYRLWLKAVICFPNESIIPNKEVDEVWHTHILDTRKYADDCESLFGCFLHHFPYFGMRGEDDRQGLHTAFAQSQAMMLEVLGENLRSYQTIDAEESLCGPENCDPSIYTDDRRPRLRQDGLRLVA